MELFVVFTIQRMTSGYSVPVWDIVLDLSTETSTILDAGQVHYQFNHEQKGYWRLVIEPTVTIGAGG
ncbi:hypothetical protein ACFWMP_15285 [Paenibacillus sp. NPDC058367]|uniref:hypothetical protein n=1 Tax=Paenibacillus sp. NPDC058367 TaxID=3346460 RepID=UPI00364EC535